MDQRQTTAFYAEYAGATGAIPDTGDPALRQYTQSYRYDAVGNLLEMKHQQGLGGAVAWRRGYAFEPGNNQLASTSAPGDDPDDPATHTDRYPYNERGAMTAMPHLPALVRDSQDQIRRAALDLAGSVAWYAYDASGQRVRKRVDKGGVQEERIYVGGYEVWRKRTVSGVQEERETVHVLDDQRRIAMVETLTMTNSSAVPNPTPRQRYQLADHLGTATLEVDEVGAVISYEEYHPFGTTSWWATDGGTEVSAKRYRYTGKERDDETGLARHGVRGYIPWLGRWERPDPIGLKGGINRWAYCKNDPVGRHDPTGTEDGPAPPEFDILQWHINDSNQFELEPSGRTAPVTDLTTVTPVNIYDPNRPDRGPNQNDADLVAANTWAGEPQFQVARYGKDLYIVDLDRMGLIPYRQWTKARAEHPYAMAIPGFIGDVLAGGPSRAGEEIVVNLGLSGLLRAGGAGSAAFGTFLAEEEGATVLIPGSRKLYPNQLPERLAEEVAAAERVGATAIEPGTPAFVDATDQGLIKFVVTADEKLLVSPYTVGGEEISHAVLSGGEPVLTAGQADIASGGGQFFGIDIVEHSGHFLPSAESLDIARALFARYGITFP